MVHRILLPSVACLVPPYFSTLSYNGQSFPEKSYWMYIFFFTTFVWNISHSMNSARYDHKCKYVFIKKSTHYPCQILVKLEFYRDFRKIVKYQISWKYVQWKSSCSIQAYGQRDMRNLVVTFRYFVNAPENDILYTPIGPGCSNFWTHGLG
jgi:hypothetical protein